MVAAQPSTCMTGEDTEADMGRVQIRLAEERNRLARERTVLAHIRTGFAAFIFGTALIGLFSGLPRLAGWFFILVGAVFIGTSGLSYALSRRRTRTLLQWPGEYLPTPWRRHGAEADS